MARVGEDNEKTRELRLRMAELGLQLCNDAIDRKVANPKDTYEAIVRIYEAIKGI